MSVFPLHQANGARGFFSRVSRCWMWSRESRFELKDRLGVTGKQTEGHVSCDTDDDGDIWQLNECDERLLSRL
jgi:hypothetical protein